MYCPDVCATCVYAVQAVAAKVEQLEVFGQQELFGPEMFDAVTGHIHLHYVRRQVRWDVIQICKDRKAKKHKSFNWSWNDSVCVKEEKYKRSNLILSMKKLCFRKDLKERE